MLDAVWLSQSCEIKLRDTNDLGMSKKKRVSANEKQTPRKTHFTSVMQKKTLSVFDSS